MSEEMSEKRVCPSCGAEVPEGAPEGLCPACVMKEAAGAETEEQASTSPARLLVPPLEKVAAAFPELEVLEFIGCGGMAAVYKARQRKLDRVVALKVLPRSFGQKEGFGERFEREGRVLAKLSHPNIVGVYDYGEADGFYFLIMEYVDGVNLRQAMRAGRFTPSQALGVVPDICNALQFAHEKGVLHRDIKPENILLDATGRVKIADFGIAKIIGDAAATEMTLTGTGSLGTPQYMAPEQVETPRDVDHRADIFSLGVVLYEMLTGELPMGRFAAPSKKSDVGAQVDEIVMRALAKERELRQQSATEMRTEVEGVTDSSAAGPRKAEAAEAEAVNPWPKRTFWLLAAILSIPVLWGVLAFVVMILTRAFSGQRPSGGPGPIGGAELVIILVIGALFLAILVAGALGVAHLMGWRRRHAPARVIASGATSNPWPRRVFWLVTLVVLGPFVVLALISVTGMVVALVTSGDRAKEAAAQAARNGEVKERMVVEQRVEKEIQGMEGATREEVLTAQNLVGSWDTMMAEPAMRMTLSADGSFSMRDFFPVAMNEASGSWIVEKGMLVVAIEKSTNPNEAGTIEKSRIRELSPNSLELYEDAGANQKTLVTYLRVHPNGGGATGGR